MMKASEATACFRFLGEGLDPDVVTRRLGIEPSEMHRKGEKRRGPRCCTPWREDLWLLASSLGEGATVEAHVGALLNELEPRAAEIQELRSAGWETSFFVGYFSNTDQCTVSLSAELLRRLGALGAEILLDVYPGSG